MKTYKKAIIQDGVVVGWENAPIPRKTTVNLSNWEKSQEGKAAYKAAEQNLIADGKGWMALKPVLSRTTGKPYWKRYDPEMYE